MKDLVKNQVGNNVIKLSISKIINMVIILLSNMLLSRFRTLSEYGTYTQILLIINLACSIFMLGLPACINYFISKSDTEEEKRKFVSIYYTLNTMLSILIGVLLLILIPTFEKIFNNDMLKLFWYFIALYPWTNVIMSSIEYFLISFNKNNFILIYRLLHSFLCLFIIILVHYLGLSFELYMILYIFLECIFTVCTYFIVKKIAGKLTICIDFDIIKQIFIFSIPIGLSSIIGTINIELDKLVINTFLTLEDLAIYSNASKELPVTIIATTFTTILLPLIVKMLKNNRMNDAIALWKSSVKISFLVLALCSIGFFTFAPEVITILYSSKYLDGVNVFRIYCLVLLFKCTYWGMILNASGNTKFIFYSSLISLFFNVCLNFVFINLFGFIGPALATLIATLMMNLVQLIYTCKKTNFSFSKIFPWKDCFIILLINLGFAVIMYNIKELFLQNFKFNNILLAIILGVIWGCFYLLIFRKFILENWKKINEFKTNL